MAKIFRGAPYTVAAVRAFSEGRLLSRLNQLSRYTYSFDLLSRLCLPDRSGYPPDQCPRTAPADRHTEASRNKPEVLRPS